MLKQVFSNVPFILCNLMAPDGAEGGGSSETVETEVTPEPEQEPAPTGNTLEEKITSALGHIKSLFQRVGALTSQLATAKGQITKVESQFNAVSADLKKEQEAHIASKKELSEVKTTNSGLITERDNANKNVERLESLCQLRGIDPKTAVAAANNGAQGSSGQSKWDEYNNLKEQEAKGQKPAGTAMAYWRENKKELNQFAKIQR